MFQGIPTLHFFQHPSSVLALRADPPSPTRGEGKAGAAPTSTVGRQTRKEKECAIRTPRRTASWRPIC
ncbi:MAG: hypothetical protein E5Y76_03100 [Mesorhizobium sp.]|nr:MAG: hypothetical protein E5Y76_03100 [Mesorhizobium sp.]